MHQDEEQIPTEEDACHRCSKLVLALSVSTVLPPVVVNLLMGGGVLKRIVEILTGRADSMAIGALSPMLAVFLLPAIAAAMLAAVLQLATSTHLRRRCGLFLLSYIAFSAFMLLCPLLPIPWRAMGLSGAVASKLEEFPWWALYGLFLMEGWAVFPHALVVIAIWCESALYGWRIHCAARDVAFTKSERLEAQRAALKQPRAKPWVGPNR